MVLMAAALGLTFYPLTLARLLGQVHYGVLLPVLAAALPQLARLQERARMNAGLLALAFAASANVVLMPDWFHKTPLRGLLSTHVFLGALLLFGLLVWLRARPGGIRNPGPARDEEADGGHATATNASRTTSAA